jgi:hypothetical protein
MSQSDEDKSFEEVFFETHGVSDVAPDPKDVELGHALDSTLPTGNEINFAFRLAKGENHIDAYIAAFGFVGNEVTRQSFSASSKRIQKRPRVADKIIDLKRKASAIAEEDMAKLVDELNEDRKLARALGQPAAAISAVKAKANLLGLEQSNTVHNTVNLNLTDDQKKQLLDRVGKRLESQEVKTIEHE